MKTKTILLLIPLIIFIQTLLSVPDLSFSDGGDRLTDPFDTKSAVVSGGEDFVLRLGAKTFKKSFPLLFVHSPTKFSFSSTHQLSTRTVFSSQFNPAFLIHSLPARAPPVF